MMEPNNPQHKSFLWHLDFEPFTWHTFYGEQCPPFVTEENKEAWKEIEDTECYKDYGMLRNNFVI